MLKFCWVLIKVADPTLAKTGLTGTTFKQHQSLDSEGYGLHAK